MLESLQALIDRNIPKEVVEQETQTDESSLDDLFKDVIKKEEEIDENMEHPMHIENVNEVVEIPNPIADSMDALSTIPRFTNNFPKKMKKMKKVKVEPKEEPIDETEAIPEDNQISGMDYSGDFNGDDMLNDDMGDGMDDMANETVDNSLNEQPSNKDMEMESIRPDSSDSVQVEKRRSSRNTTKPLHYNMELLNDSDGDSEPEEKKSRFDAGEKKKKDKKRVSHKKEDQATSDGKKRRVYRLNDTELECPECEYRTRSVHAWVQHLRETHSTNPYLAGLALLCECGNECFSSTHSATCDVSKFTVVRKRDGPIRRLDDEKTTPQCVLCEIYPKTPCGYINHLRNHHESTLYSNEIYLVCACGLEVRNNNDSKHADECDKRQFTLHKLNEK